MVTNDRHDEANKTIEQEINAVLMTPIRVKENGCVACHILFTLVNRMEISEAAGLRPALRNSISKRNLYRCGRKDPHETKNDGCIVLTQKP
ncbi:MAG: hypothetical protein M3Y53_07740 [Thermoproteota archaeon]|nr:hypothetical protein [Thermoproteota archaeon]